MLTLDDLTAGAGLPWGGYKYRMHQLTSAVARVQLRELPRPGWPRSTRR